MANEKILTLDNYIYIASEEEKIYAKKSDLPTVPVKAVSKNGTAISPDANGTVDVTVPTKVSELTNDSSFAENVIEQVKVNGTALEVNGKAVNITIDTTAEENQNAFSKVKSGATTIEADSKTDTLNIAGGSNVTVTVDAGTDTVTIAAQDTTYSAVAAGGESGLMTGADKTKLDGIDTGAQANVIESVTVGGTAAAVANKAVALGSAAGASTASSVANDATLPTGAAVKSFVEGKGYITEQEASDLIDSKTTSTYIPSGSIAPSSVTSSLLVEANLGNVYNLSAAMTLNATTAPLFVDGAVGEKIEEGTNIQIIKSGNSYLFDAMAGFIDLSGYAMKTDIQYATNAEIATAMGYPTA